MIWKSIVLGFVLIIGQCTSNENAVEIANATTTTPVDDILDNLKNQLDISSMKVMTEFNNPPTNERDENDDSRFDFGKSRTRREIITWYEEVQDAQKTANREELFLRRSLPVLSSEYFSQAHQILPLELGSVLDRWQYFAVTKNGSNTIIIAKYDTLDKMVSVHTILFEKGLLNLAVFHGYVNPSSKVKFFAAAGEGLSIYEIDLNNPTYSFIKIQSNPLPHIRALKFVEIKQETFFVLGVHKTVINGGAEEKYEWQTNVQIFKYHSNQRYFHYHSMLPGSGISDVECFVSQTKAYLIVANYRNDVGTLESKTQVYEYNINLGRFLFTQSLSSSGALDIEHFVLSNEDFIIIANEASGTIHNKVMNEHSFIYRLNKGKFQLLQTLETYGAKIWKHVSIPNCKQDVLLIYGDQRGNMDQVGIFSFSHNEEMFNAVPFEVYGAENITSDFRPQPNTISTFTTRSNVTGKFDFMLVIGANNTDQGSSMYQISYDIILRDSPMEAFKRFVAQEIGIITSTLNEIKNLLNTTELILADVVLKTGKQTITGSKTINNLALDNVFIDTLMITTGSILYSVNQTTYLADPNQVQPTNISVLEIDVQRHQTRIDGMDNKTFWLLNANTNITTNVFFENSSTSQNLLIHNNLNVSTINNVEMDQLCSNLVNLQDSTSISGNKLFIGQQTINNMEVNGNINHLDFHKDVFIDGNNQTINGTKTFHKSITINGNLYTNKIMDIDLSETAVFTDQPVTLLAPKTFSAVVTSDSANIHVINYLPLNELFTDCFRKSIPQQIVGNKIFTSITSDDNVIINQLVNGIDLVTLKNKMSSNRQNQNIAEGNKVFNSNVTIKGILHCQQNVNDVNITSDVILNNQDITFNLTQHFHEVHMKKTLQVDQTIAGINTSHLVKINGYKTLGGVFSFQNDVVAHNLSMNDHKQINEIDFSNIAQNAVRLDQEETLGDMQFTKIVLENHNINQLNDKSLSDYVAIFDNTLHKTGDQTFESVGFTRNVHSTDIIDTSLINGHQFPEDFARKSSNQTFQHPVTFTESQTFEKDLFVSDSIIDIDIDQFLDNLLYKDEDEIVSHFFQFNQEVNIKKDLITNSTINGVDLSDHLLQRTGYQQITGHKIFSILNLTDNHAEVQGDLGVSETIDGVDLSDLDLSGMQITRNETIAGEKCFEATDYNRSVNYINGIDVSALAADIVTLDTNQIIESEKIFIDIEINTDIETSSTINGVNITQLKEELYSKKTPQTSFENLIIQGDVQIEGDTTIQSINNTDITKLHNVLSKYNTNNISTLIINGASVIDNLEVQNVNNVRMDKVIYRSNSQTITGHKTINGQLDTLHLETHQIDRIDIDNFLNSVVTKDTDQLVNGSKHLASLINVLGNVTTKYINSVNISEWNFIRTKGVDEQTVYLQITFKDKVSFASLNVSKINDINIANFFNQVVTTKMNHTFPDLMEFTNGINTESLHSTGDDLLLGTINGLPILRRLQNETLQVNGDQSFCCLTGQQFVVKNLTTNLINSLRIPEDFVTKMTSQTISGYKQFENVKFTKDIQVNQKLNGILFKDMIKRTLFKSSNHTQTMHGLVTFKENVQFVNLVSSGNIGGVLVTEENLVTLHTDQTIQEDVVLLQNLFVETLKVTETINGLNLTQLYHNAIRRNTNETMTGHLYIVGNLAVYGNINLTGLTNGIDLSNYELNTPAMDDTLTTAENALMGIIGKQCSSLAFITNALAGFGYRLDYFTLHQELSFKNARHSQVFTINNELYVAVSIFGKSYTMCGESYIYKWNSTTKTLEEYQAFPTAGVEQMKVGRVQDQSFLFVLNSYEGCANVPGPLQILSWSTSTNKFEYLYFLTKQTDIAFTSSGDHLHIFLNGTIFKLSSEGVLSSLDTPVTMPSASHLDVIDRTDGETMLTFGKASTNSTSRSTLEVYRYSDSNPTSVQFLATVGLSRTTSFTIDNDLFLIVANDRDQSGSYATYHVSVDVYRMKNGANTFQLFQKIPSYKAVDVSVATFGSQTLLAITHHEQSVSVYRLALDLGFLLLEEIPVAHCQSASFFEAGNESYLMVTTDSDVHKTKVLELNPIGIDVDALDQIGGC